MDLLSPHNWIVHRAAWSAAVQRLHAEPGVGTLEAAVLTPLVEHFERAWTQLGVLVALAAPFVAPPGTRPLPIQHLAAFIVDDLLDVFRGAASEVELLIPDGGSWNGDPSPEDILDEIERFDRYLVLSRNAAMGSAGLDPLSTGVCRVSDVLADWSADLPGLVAPIREILEALRFGAGDGLSTAPRRHVAN